MHANTCRKVVNGMLQTNMVMHVVRAAGQLQWYSFSNDVPFGVYRTKEELPVPIGWIRVG